MAEFVQLEVVKISHPWDFKAFVKSADTTERRSFQQLFDKLNDFFTNDQIVTAVPYSHGVSEVCAGKSHKDKQWHRVRVEDTLATVKGSQINCFFVDDGRTEVIPTQWLKHLPETFLSVPFQVKKFSLYGLHPLSMVMSPEDLDTKVRPVKKWDSAAVDFMRQQIKAARSVNAVVRHEGGDKDRTVYVDLYLQLPQQLMQFNQELVRQNFATDNPDKFEDGTAYMDLPNTGVAARKGPTTEEMLKWRSRHRTPGSGVACVGNTDDRAYGSESELQTFLTGNRNSSNCLVNDSEQDCLTDTSELKIPHRRNKTRASLMRETQLLENDQMPVLKPHFQVPDNGDMVLCEREREPLSTGHRLSERLQDSNQNMKSSTETLVCSEQPSSKSSLSSQNLTPSQMPRMLSPGRGIFRSAPVASQTVSPNSNSALVGRTTEPQPSPTNVTSPTSVPETKAKYGYTPSIDPSRSSPNLSAISAADVSKKVSPLQARLQSLKDSADSPSQGQRTSPSGSFSSSCSDSNNPPRISFGRGANLKSLIQSITGPGTENTKVLQDSPSSRQQQENSKSPVSEHARSLTRNQGRSFKPDSTSGSDSNTSQTVQSDNMLGEATYKKARLPKLDSTSGSDSNTGRTVQSDTMLGEMTFKKARLPKQATLNGQKQVLPRKSQQDRHGNKSDASEPELKTAVARQQAGPMSASAEVREPQRAAKRLTELLKNEEGEASGGNTLKQNALQESLMRKFNGEKLLKKICPNAKPGSADSSKNKKQTTQRPWGMFGAEDNVLVHGVCPMNAVRKFSEAYFAEEIKRILDQKDFLSPTLVQAYSWPPILRGRHVISISPNNTGKTYAYLLPLLTYLLQPKIYEEIRIGNGPYVIVLVSASYKADQLYRETLYWTEGLRRIRTVVAYGGGQEENQAFNLINGCEVLVVTVPCLKRLVTKRYTDLNRLCHLVIDDADIVLENYYQEMRELMTNYSAVIQNLSDHSQAPRQLLLFSRRWNRALESFMKGYLVEPLLIITSPFEAAIYGQVKQETHMCKLDQRLRKVLDLLEATQDDSSKTIVFFTRKDDLINTYQILEKRSVYSMMIHQDMELFQIQQVLGDWDSSLTLLLCSDNNVADLEISDAKTVIHFDMPNSKTKFCNRLSCMRQFYRNFCPEPKKSTSAKTTTPVVPTSHLIVSEDCQPQIKSIVQLLKRSNCSVPVKLKAMLAGFQQGLDEDKLKPLCPNLLAFGVCRNQLQCADRHLVFPDVDVPPQSSWIPDEGEAKVLVTHMLDASHYFVRLLGVRREGTTAMEDLSVSFIALQMELTQWYSNKANQIKHTAPCSGELCGYQEDENFYRVEILDIVQMNQHGKAMSTIDAEVRFVDSGREESIPTHKLFVLPAQLKTIPYQAVEVFVCRVKPVDSDTNWTPMADHFIYNLLHGRELEGKIVLRLGYMLWLDPLVERVSLEERTIVNKSYVHTELLRNGMADANPVHLEKLYKLCEGKVKITKALLRKTKFASELETDVLPECDLSHQVHVSAVHEAKPNPFFVQRHCSTNRLEQLMDEINSYVAKPDAVQPSTSLTVGKFCLAEYTAYDQRWYRGQVVKVEEDSYQIFFADYGDEDTVAKDKVCDIPKGLFQDLPLQAIECKLAGVEITDDSALNMMAGNVLWDLTHYVNGIDMKTLTAKVTGKEGSSYTGRTCYVVELSSAGMNLAQELLWQQLMVQSENSSLDHLFGKVARTQRVLYNSPIERIPDLCAFIYWEPNPSRALYLAEDIKSILAQSESYSALEEGTWCRAACSVVKLVSRVRWANVHSVILDCVCVFSKLDGRVVEEMMEAGCVELIVQCLELNYETAVQYHAAETIARLSAVSGMLKSEFEAVKNFSILQELLDSTKSEQVQSAVCKAFTALCSGSDSVCEKILKASAAQKLSGYLIDSAEHKTSESIILLLSALASYDSCHSELKREVLIDAIIKNLSTSDCDKCIQHSIQLCDNFAALRRKHKTFLLEHEMVPVLNRILKLDLSGPTCQLCKDLLRSLVVKVPSEPISGVRLKQESHGRNGDVDALEGVPPPVNWSQNICIVLLSVKVAGVVESPDMVSIEDRAVTFRSTVDGVMYYFAYQLWDTILPAKSKVKVRQGEVLISLRKLEKGNWPRLLQQKQRPAHLSVDYERLMDSSEEEVLDDESQPFTLKAKKKKCFSDKHKKPPKARLLNEDGEVIAASDTSTSDSLENMDDVEPDPYALF